MAAAFEIHLSIWQLARLLRREICVSFNVCPQIIAKAKFNNICVKSKKLL